MAARAPRAGSMESRNGNASVVPRPRRKVRRASVRLVRNTAISLSSHLGGRTLHVAIRGDIHAEHVAHRHVFDQSAQLVAIAGRGLEDASYCRHVVVLDAAAQ